MLIWKCENLARPCYTILNFLPKALQLIKGNFIISIMHLFPQCNVFVRVPLLKASCNRWLKSKFILFSFSSFFFRDILEKLSYFSISFNRDLTWNLPNYLDTFLNSFEANFRDGLEINNIVVVHLHVHQFSRVTSRSKTWILLLNSCL